MSDLRSNSIPPLASKGQEDFFSTHSVAASSEPAKKEPSIISTPPSKSRCWKFFSSLSSTTETNPSVEKPRPRSFWFPKIDFSFLKINFTFPKFTFFFSSKQNTPPQAPTVLATSDIIPLRDFSEEHETWTEVASETGDEQPPLTLSNAPLEASPRKSFSSSMPSLPIEKEEIIASSSLQEISPWEGLLEQEQLEIKQQLPSGKPILKLGAAEIDSTGALSLPCCSIYQIIDVPTEQAAAIFWDLEALHATAPNRIKTSIVSREGQKVEATFEIRVSTWMPHDISSIITTVEPTADGGYLFTWNLSPKEQPKSYSKAIKGTLLLLPDKVCEGKTLLVYRSISTLKNQHFYGMAAKEVVNTIEATVAGTVKAMLQGKDQKASLQRQQDSLQAACQESKKAHLKLDRFP